MTTYTVLHLKNLRDADGDAYLLKRDDFLMVAQVEVEDELEVEAQLEVAYKATNSIHHHWSENSGVTQTQEKRQRSTSVGDVIYNEKTGVHWIVSMIGFNKVTIDYKTDYGVYRHSITGKQIFIPA